MRQARGRHEQSKQKEDSHLGHLGEGIEEVCHFDLARDIARAQHDAGQVNGQKAVAAQVARQGVGNDRHGEQKDGLCAFGRGLRAPHQAR